MAAGRPSKYNTHVKPKFNEIANWIAEGATEKEVAKSLGVSITSFIDYKEKNPEFADLLKRNRKQAVKQIKAAMMKKACGFQYKEIKTTVTKIGFSDYVIDKLEEAGIDADRLERPTLTKMETTVKTAAPDATAGIYLLKHWDKEQGWTTDPQTLELKKKELKLKEKHYEESDW